MSNKGDSYFREQDRVSGEREDRHRRAEKMSKRFKTYVGERTPSGCIVTVNGRPLLARLNWWAHSPTGFEWGYGGSGPAQLALAILGDHLGVEARDRAIQLHQQFKFRVVAKLPREGWTLTSADVECAVAEIEAERLERALDEAGTR